MRRPLDIKYDLNISLDKSIFIRSIKLNFVLSVFINFCTYEDIKGVCSTQYSIIEYLQLLTLLFLVRSKQYPTLRAVRIVVGNCFFKLFKLKHLLYVRVVHSRKKAVNFFKSLPILAC